MFKRSVPCVLELRYVCVFSITFAALLTSPMLCPDEKFYKENIELEWINTFFHVVPSYEEAFVLDQVWMGKLEHAWHTKGLLGSSCLHYRYACAWGSLNFPSIRANAVNALFQLH